MIVGIDLDNTIINYNNSFKILAKKNKIINKSSKQFNKSQIKEKLTKIDENLWTKLQGEIYGKYINYAKIFPGFVKFINFLNKNNINFKIISHKTKYPYIGQKYNLHTSAINYLKSNLSTNLKLGKNLFFESTLKKKIIRIKKENCDIFIDDLEKVFLDKSFPTSTIKILYKNRNLIRNVKNIESWEKIRTFLKKILNDSKKIKTTNNTIYILKNSKILIKKFNQKDKDKCFNKEIKFIKYCNKINVKKIPEVIGYSIKNKKIIYKLLDNNKIKLNEKKIIEIFRFIEDLNKKNIKRNEFFYAKDYCRNLDCEINNLKKRVSNLSKNKNLKKETLFIKKKLDFYIQNLFKINNFKLKKSELIISPCDFNINNIILDKKKFYFIDFEYSGLDSYSKLISVFILQPDYYIPYNLFKKIINKIINILPNNKNKNLKILTSLIPLIYLKWSLIILNQINKSKNRTSFYKSKFYKYIQSREEYFIKFTKIVN